MSSLRYPLAVDTSLHATAKEGEGATYVEQLIRQVLFTSLGERVNRPDFGCGIRRMVFAPNSEVAAGLAQVTVYQALSEWLGGWIRVDAVRVSPREERLEVQIAYTLRSVGEQHYLNLAVST